MKKALFVLIASIFLASCGEDDEQITPVDNSCNDRKSLILNKKWVMDNDNTMFFKMLSGGDSISGTLYPMPSNYKFNEDCNPYVYRFGVDLEASARFRNVFLPQKLTTDSFHFHIYYNTDTIGFFKFHRE